MTHLILTLNATAFLSAVLTVVLKLLYKKYKHSLIKSYGVSFGIKPSGLLFYHCGLLIRYWNDSLCIILIFKTD